MNTTYVKKRPVSGHLRVSKFRPGVQDLTKANRNITPLASKKVYNVGVIGLGEQGWDNLLPSLAVLRQANIKAVCDLDRQRRITAARNYGATEYDNFLEMLDNEMLDVVVVASHPAVHQAVLEVTLARGIPTFVEKPPTLHTKDLQKLIKLNQLFGTFTAVGLNFSYTEPVRFLKQLMQKPEFGKLKYLRVSHYGNKPDDVIWGLKSKARSFLLSQAIHPLGLLFDFGQPVADSRMINAHHSPAGLLFDVSMRMQEKDGNQFSAELLTSSTSPFFEWQLQLISDKGVMVNVNSLLEIEVYSKHRANPMIENQKWWRDLWRPSPLTGGFKRNGYEHQFSELFGNVAAGKTNATSLENMAPIYELIDAMEKLS